MKRQSSRSDVQQLVEKLMVGEFSQHLNKTLLGATIPLGSTSIQVDGFCRDEHGITIVEAWAHIGKAKSAQRNKVLGDMLKLVLLKAAFRSSCPNTQVDAYLLFADSTAAKCVTGKGWPSLATKEFGISSHVLVLSSEVTDTIKEAQRRQDIRRDGEFNDGEELSSNCDEASQ